MQKADIEYFAELLKKIVADTAAFDALIEPHIDIPLQQLDAMEHCILRIGVYELSQRLDIPFRVILNEAVSLAKKFGAEDGHKFVNAVLDKAATHLRPHESTNT